MALSQEDREFFQKHLNRASRNDLLDALDSLNSSAITKIKAALKAGLLPILCVGERLEERKENRTFDLRMVYEQNPSDLENPDKLVLGMGTCLWTDWYVKQSMIDQRVFPRIFALAEQMWHKGKSMSYNDFYLQLKSKYPLFCICSICSAGTNVSLLA